MMFDTHAHLCSDAFTSDEFYQIVQRAKSAGLDSILNIATTPLELERARAQKKEFPWLLIAASTTPHDADKDEEFFPFFKQAAENGELTAIGETGLDYFYENSNKQLQKKSLIRYIELAKRVSVPLIIHCREAFEDLFAILEEHFVENGKLLPGVLHCFTGNEEEAFYLAKKGWMLSCSGIITFKKSDSLRKIFQKLPLDRILIETDSPYLAPQPMRGKRNEPSYLLETAKLLAELREISFEELILQLRQNAKTIFRS